MGPNIKKLFEFETLGDNWPLWVKYGAKTACQPPAAKNPGNAPDFPG